jgi:phenylalanyl-tRNA synthetase beta chain
MSLPMKDRTTFKPLDRFPGSVFDLTVVTPSNTHASDVIAVVEGMKMKEIRNVGILDVYKLDQQSTALTLHLEFRDTEKTLDAEFIKQTEERVIQVLKKAGYPLRA